MDGNEVFLPVPFSPNKKRDTSTCPTCYHAIKGKKKFCSKDCERIYTERQEMLFCERMDSCLRKNRLIIKELSAKRKKVVSKKELLEKGYDFDYCTQYIKNTVFYDEVYCFEYGLEIMQGNNYRLLKLNAIESKLMKGQ